MGSSQGKQKGARPRGLGHLTRTPPTPPVLAARGSLGLEAGAEATGAGRARGEGGGHRGAPAGHVDSGAVLWGAGGHWKSSRRGGNVTSHGKLLAQLAGSEEDGGRQENHGSHTTCPQIVTSPWPGGHHGPHQIHAKTGGRQGE